MKAKLIIDNSLKRIFNGFNHWASGFEYSMKIRVLINETGIKFQQYSIDNTMVVILEISKHSFQEFECEEEFNFIIEGNQKDNFLEKVAAKIQDLNISKHKEFIRFQIGGFSYLFPTVEEKQFRRFRGGLPTNCTIQIPAIIKILKSILRGQESSSLRINFENESNGLTIHEEYGPRSKIPYSFFSPSVSNWNVPEKHEVSFNAKFFPHIIKQLSSHSWVYIEIGTGTPIAFTVKFGLGNILFFAVSPLKEDDDY